MKGIKKTRRSMASRLVAVFSVLLSAFTLTTGCGNTTTAATSQDTESQDNKQIVIGFSQLGAESDTVIGQHRIHEVDLYRRSGLQVTDRGWAAATGKSDHGNPQVHPAGC